MHRLIKKILYKYFFNILSYRNQRSQGGNKVELKQTKHSYYCECWESQRTSEYENWEAFKKEGLDYDFDYNLLFRFDIDFHDDPEDEHVGTYTLKLHHALQRHGYEQWHAVIHNIKEEDMVEIEEHLKKAKKHLMEMWKEIEVI